MYTATMIYKFKADGFDKACELWEKKVLDLASRQPGFVRMQFLVNSPEAMAIGTWEDESNARAFMETGVFKDLMEVLKPYVDGDPKARIWDLLYFKDAT